MKALIDILKGRQMANEPMITVVGNLGADPEFKKTPNGTSVTSFSIANTPRKQKNGEWTDGDVTWFRVFVWNYEAAGTAVALKKGDKVIVTGRFQVSVYTDKEGTERKSLEINSDGVGVIPRFTPEPIAKVDARSDEDPVDFPW
jgi:single-strand DNA-binding protein